MCILCHQSLNILTGSKIFIYPELSNCKYVSTMHTKYNRLLYPSYNTTIYIGLNDHPWCTKCEKLVRV